MKVTKILLPLILAMLCSSVSGYIFGADGASFSMIVALLMGLGCYLWGALELVGWLTSIQAENIVLSKLDPDRAYQLLVHKRIPESFYAVHSLLCSKNKDVLYVVDLTTKRLRVAVLTDSYCPPPGFRVEITQEGNHERTFLVPEYKKVIYSGVEGKDYIILPS